MVESGSATGRTLPPLPDPGRLALLLDVDGTLAPIVNDPTDASVPLETRRTLVTLARALGLVACVSGRTAEDARRVVGVGAITYIGGHGSELLEPGSSEAETDPQLDLWEGPVNEAAIEAMRDLSPLGVRREEKGPIAALHWRGVTDEAAVVEGLGRHAEAAEASGLVVHWGRKVLEIRPPVPFDKGRGIERLLTRRIESGLELDAAIYAGDDTTDLDAFDALDRLVDASLIGSAVKVAVRSAECPPELLEQGDLTVDGTEGLAQLLEGLPGIGGDDR